MANAKRRRASSLTAPTTVTYGIVARDAALALILRRGPTRHTRLLLWNLTNDAVVGGQWLVGRVDPATAGLSPSGELFVYEARKGLRTFTAISRPPYFTALAYWEYTSAWTGSGFFASDRAVVLGLRFADPYGAGTFPGGFEVTDVHGYFARRGCAPGTLRDAIAGAPEANHGWTGEASGTFRKPNPVRSRLCLERTRCGRHQRRYAVVDEGRAGAPTTTELGVVDWADWAHDGTLLLGKEGKLHRQPLPHGAAKAWERPRLVADLTKQQFEHVAPPAAALRWPRVTAS